MNKIESEEASNDDTTIISQLLNSDEVMQTTTMPITNVSSLKMPLLQKDEVEVTPNTGGMSPAFCDTTKPNMLVSLQQSHSIIGGGLLNSSQYSNIDDLNKMDIRHVHIPYILNGELYQIQTQDGENVTVKCCHCPPDRVYRGSVRSTGNFHMHIKRRHPDLLEKLHDMKVNALLERRDRLMRNRKINHRNTRNRPNNSIRTSNDICSFKNEEKSELATKTPGSQITFGSTNESSLMHTHKLKIKTVFQRHQMQQREAEEMRNWSNAEFVVMPIGKLPPSEESEQPINYSFKNEQNHVLSSSSLNIIQIPQQQHENKTPHVITQTSFDGLTNISNQPTNLSSYNRAVGNALVCENYTNKRNLSTSSISVTCPSVISSYTSTHQFEIDIDRRSNGDYLERHNLSIIKPEQLTLGEEAEAIDLTMRTDSGIYSSCEDNDSENNNESRINNIRSGTQKPSNANIAECNRNSDNNNSYNNANWQELFMQVEHSLRDIHREMSVRNQIESNRMFLDIAKFKYLNPGFQFNW